RPWQGRGDHRQAAPRPDRHRQPAVRGLGHALRQSRAGRERARARPGVLDKLRYGATGCPCRLDWSRLYSLLGGPMAKTWTVQDAKAQLSELLRRARAGEPQRIGMTDACVVVSEKDWA